MSDLERSDGIFPTSRNDQASGWALSLLRLEMMNAAPDADLPSPLSWEECAVLLAKALQARSAPVSRVILDCDMLAMKERVSTLERQLEVRDQLIKELSARKDWFDV